jgi:hypothetical protein
MVYTGKVISLLELGPTQNYDLNFEKSIYYCWAETDKFDNFPIYNTDGSVEVTLELLQKYYDEGFRIFIGFNRLGMLVEVIPWFNSHPDAIGITSVSSNTVQPINKNIYQMRPSNTFVINYLSDNVFTPTVENGGRIFYVYNSDELISISLAIYLETKYGVNNVIKFPISPDYSNLTKENIVNFYESNSVSSKDVCLIIISDYSQDQKYVDFFTQDFNIYAPQYDILFFPVINPNNTSLNNLYNVVNSENITTSQLQIDGTIYLNNLFVLLIPNTLYLATALALGQNINYLYSYGTVLEFDSNNAIKYSSIKLYTFQTDSYVPLKIHCSDPLYGVLDFVKIN